MIPELYQSYEGFNGEIYRVEAIEGHPDYPWVTIRAASPPSAPRHGTITFAMREVENWLKPITGWKKYLGS